MFARNALLVRVASSAIALAAASASMSFLPLVIWAINTEATMDRMAVTPNMVKMDSRLA